MRRAGIAIIYSLCNVALLLISTIVELLGGAERDGVQPARVSDDVIQNGEPDQMDIPLEPVHAVCRILALRCGAQQDHQSLIFALYLGYGLLLGFGHVWGGS